MNHMSRSLPRARIPVRPKPRPSATTATAPVTKPTPADVAPLPPIVIEISDSDVVQHLIEKHALDIDAIRAEIKVARDNEASVQELRARLVKEDNEARAQVGLPLIEQPRPTVRERTEIARPAQKPGMPAAPARPLLRKRREPPPQPLTPDDIPF